MFFSHSLKGFREKKTTSRSEYSRWHRCSSMFFTSLRLFSISIRHLFGCMWNWSKPRRCYIVFGQPLKRDAAVMCVCLFWNWSVLNKNRCQYCLVCAISVMFCIFAFSFLLRRLQQFPCRDCLQHLALMLLFFLISWLFLCCKHFRKGWISLADEHECNFHLLHVNSPFIVFVW